MPSAEKESGFVKPAPSPLILGIDPGLSVTGYGLIRPRAARSAPRPEAEYVEAGVLRTSESHPLERRLLEIQRGVEEILSEFSPGVLAVEALYSHYAHPRTAILMGHARGVVCCTAASRGIPVRDYAATQIKRALTGNGRAGKGQVQRAIAHYLAFPSVPEPPDVADALAVALCHLEAERERTLVSASRPSRP
ncbi:MAG: crossover junction endodeoxyribonuclease RuvC [Candidatus Tectomicrobia bacterium]|nr:crossover junction endodeoxyribonuclease RuvC [Candidatus Tectomicrobia bacterium]